MFLEKHHPSTRVIAIVLVYPCPSIGRRCCGSHDNLCIRVALANKSKEYVVVLPFLKTVGRVGSNSGTVANGCRTARFCAINTAIDVISSRKCVICAC